MVEQKQQRKRRERQGSFKRAEAFVEESRRAEREDVRLRRLATKGTGSVVVVPDEPTCVFVVRQDLGKARPAPKPRQVLELLRLTKPWTGVFIRLTPATATMLAVVAPHVAFGQPSTKVIRDLVYKRGHARIGTGDAATTVPLADNALVEEHLGEYGILSIDDIVHELATLGPNFKPISQFLAPVAVPRPSKAYRDPKMNAWVKKNSGKDKTELLQDLLANL